jgi:lipocalin
VFTLKCDSALVTLQHNAGIILKGGANFIFGSTANITLRRVGGTWYEVGRSA